MANDDEHSTVRHAPQDPDPNARRFIPQEYFGEDIELWKVERPSWEYIQYAFVNVACPRLELICESCGRTPAHSDSLVIAVDGACRDNGRENARAAVGVYVGEGSPYNKSARLPGVITNQVAEITAGIEGLTLARKLLPIYKNLEGRIRHIVIKADSEYFVKGMTEWVLKWEKNGYRNAAGRPVVNQELFKQALNNLELLEHKGIKVQFWHVPREENSFADALANAALDEY
jgi:ribonuclease HI